MEKMSATTRMRALVCLAVVSVILSEDLCDFEVEEENSSATEMRANVHTDIRLLLPRRLESLDDAFFQNISG